MVETEFLLQLLVRLLADPTRLDGAGERLEWRIDGQVRDIVLALAIGAAFSDQPGLLTRQVLAAHVSNALRRPVGDTHPHGSETCRQTAFRAAAPAGHILPMRCGRYSDGCSAAPALR